MNLKRSSSSLVRPPSIRRSKPDCCGYTPFVVLNIRDGETVRDSSLLVTGQCHDFEEPSQIHSLSRPLTSKEIDSQNAKPHRWPVSGGSWEAYVELATGLNHLEFQLYHAGGVIGNHRLAVYYDPPEQTIPATEII